MALPTVSATAARRVIDQFAADHEEFGTLIRTLGAYLLDQAASGLRDGREALNTYDLSFVGNRGSFACITAAHGKYNRVERGRLRVEARFDGTPEGLEVFKPKRRSGERWRGWHFAHLSPECADIDAVLRDLRRTLR